MKRLLLVLITWLMVTQVHAEFGTNNLLKPTHIDVNDREQLQRGARVFMNYCSGCHSLRYLRYNRMAENLGLITFDGEIDKDLLMNNLVFTQANIQDPIRVSMLPKDARKWFGVVPPDLTLSVREKGANWIYTYLKSFYADSSRPFGANNYLVPDVAMPNVLEPLIGQVIAVDHNNKPSTKEISHLLLVEKGEMSESEFNSTLEDLVAFLSYASEPAKLVRHRIGIFVMIYLIIFLIIAYRLKRAYWQKIH